MKNHHTFFLVTFKKSAKLFCFVAGLLITMHAFAKPFELNQPRFFVKLSAGAAYLVAPGTKNTVELLQRPYVPPINLTAINSSNTSGITITPSLGYKMFFLANWQYLLGIKDRALFCL